MLNKRGRFFMRTTLLLAVTLMAANMNSASANEPFVIVASPSMADPLQALGQAFEAKHPDVKVRLHYGSGLELRQMIAAMENRDRTKYFIGSGPIHLIAPGGDELLTRLEQRYYVLPGSRTPYATASLVLVARESLVEAPPPLKRSRRMLISGSQWLIRS